MSKQDKKSPPDFIDGFESQKYYFHVHASDDIDYVHLMVPRTREFSLRAKNSFDAAVKKKHAALAALDMAEAQRDDELGTGAAASVTSANSVASVAFGDFKLGSKKEESKEKSQQETERLALEERFAADVAQQMETQMQTPAVKHYQVHSVDAPLVLLKPGKVREKAENLVIFKSLKERGAWRRLAEIPAERFDAVFKELHKSHPLFAEVIHFAQKSLKLCLSRGQPQCVPPILLAGPPGLGKTHFAKALAQAMNAELHQLSFDSSLKASALMGQDKGWSNNDPGAVFDAVIGGNCANPVIVLDEIDKCRGLHTNQQHPLSSLHGLLEPVTARQVTDISMGLQFDASLVSWICTCNFTQWVPATLQSRMQVFNIYPPMDAALALSMATVMLDSTHAQMQLEGFDAPDPKLATLIAHLSPREQRQVLEYAYADAVAGERTALRAQDFAYLDYDSNQSPPDQLLH